MCTTTCPCPNTTDFSSWNETYLNSIGRTKLAKIGYVPMVKSVTGTTYNNFLTCYNSVNQTYKATGQSSGLYYMNNDLLNVIYFFENTLNCEGICAAAPFFIYKDISKGRPTQSCLSTIKDTFSGKIRPLGILLGIIFILCFIAFITTCGLCYRKAEDNHHHYGKNETTTVRVQSLTPYGNVDTTQNNTTIGGGGYGSYSPTPDGPFGRNYSPQKKH